LGFGFSQKPAAQATRATRPLPSFGREPASVSIACDTGPSGTSGTERLHFLLTINEAEVKSSYSERLVEQAPVKVFSRGDNMEQSFAEDLHVNYYISKNGLKSKAVANKRIISVNIDPLTISA
jgi:hypothetical protein